MSFEACSFFVFLRLHRALKASATRRSFLPVGRRFKQFRRFGVACGGTTFHLLIPRPRRITRRRNKLLLVFPVASPLQLDHLLHPSAQMFAKGFAQGDGVKRAVELAVDAQLEAGQEKHDFRHPDVGIVAGKERGRLADYLQFAVARRAVIAVQRKQLRFEPEDRLVPPVSLGQQAHGGRFGQVGHLEVVEQAALHVGVETGGEALKSRVLPRQ